MQKPAAPTLSSGHSVHPAQGESSQCSDLSGYTKPPSSLSATQRVSAVPGSELPLLPHSFLPSDPGRWNIEDVYEFISSLPGGICLNCPHPDVVQVLTDTFVFVNDCVEVKGNHGRVRRDAPGYLPDLNLLLHVHCL